MPSNASTNKGHWDGMRYTASAGTRSPLPSSTGPAGGGMPLKKQWNRTFSSEGAASSLTDTTTDGGGAAVTRRSTDGGGARSGRGRGQSQALARGHKRVQRGRDRGAVARSTAW